MDTRHCTESTMLTYNARTNTNTLRFRWLSYLPKCIYTYYVHILNACRSVDCNGHWCSASIRKTMYSIRYFFFFFFFFQVFFLSVGHRLLSATIQCFTKRLKLFGSTICSQGGPALFTIRGYSIWIASQQAIVDWNTSAARIIIIIIIILVVMINTYKIVEVNTKRVLATSSSLLSVFRCPH